MLSRLLTFSRGFHGIVKLLWNFIKYSFFRNCHHHSHFSIIFSDVLNMEKKERLKKMYAENQGIPILRSVWWFWATHPPHHQRHSLTHSHRFWPYLSNERNFRWQKHIYRMSWIGLKFWVTLNRLWQVRLASISTIYIFIWQTFYVKHRLPIEMFEFLFKPKSENGRGGGWCEVWGKTFFRSTFSYTEFGTLLLKFV